MPQLLQQTTNRVDGNILLHDRSIDVNTTGEKGHWADRPPIGKAPAHRHHFQPKMATLRVIFGKRALELRTGTSGNWMDNVMDKQSGGVVDSSGDALSLLMSSGQVAASSGCCVDRSCCFGTVVS